VLIIFNLKLILKSPSLNQKLDCLNLLKEAGADFLLKAAKGNNLLHLSATDAPKGLDVANWLKENELLDKMDVNEENLDGETAFLKVSV